MTDPIRSADLRRGRLHAPLFAFVALLLAGCAGPSGAAGGGAEGDVTGPALAVMIVVDQLRPDLVERYDDLWTGGLRRLVDDGFSFTSASHAHAFTETAAGHATLATGVRPARHGIVANGWQERRGQGAWNYMYAVADGDVPVLGQPDAEGRSPENLLRPGLAEWVCAASDDARVVAVSKKDRGAITMAGHVRDAHVYWIDEPAGRFVTSTWYRDAYPGWVEAVNRDVVAGVMADTVWELTVTPQVAARARPDSSSVEGVGGQATFPHRAMAELDDPTPAEIHDWVVHTPAPDSAVLEMALAATRELELGRRGVVDLLAVSFSQVDYVGHRYGPMSVEQLETLLHLDRMLGHLFDALDRTVGEGRWTAAFSADHGVLRYPELRRLEGEPGLRMSRAELDAFADRMGEVLREGDAGSAAGAARLAEAAEAFDFVARAYTHEQIRAGEPADTFIPLYRNALREDRRAGLLSPFGVELRWEPGVLAGYEGGGTTHGSPYWYDRHVPLVFLGAGVRRGVSSLPAETWDAAPTLAALVGIGTPDDLDGRSLAGEWNGG